MSAILSMLYPSIVTVPEGRIIRLVNIRETIPTEKGPQFNMREYQRGYYEINKRELGLKKAARRAERKNAAQRRVGSPVESVGVQLRDQGGSDGRD